MQEALTDEAEIKKWFEEIGSLCGDALYTGREKKSLRDIESYTLGWGSTKDGVVVEIVELVLPRKLRRLGVVFRAYNKVVHVTKRAFVRQLFRGR